VTIAAAAGGLPPAAAPNPAAPAGHDDAGLDSARSVAATAPGASTSVWFLHLPSIPVVPMAGHLTAHERGIAGRVRSVARDHWVRCRGALKTILSLHTGCPAGDVVINEGKDTKPSLVANPLGLRFNVSHSGDHAVIALGHARLGVDIEMIRETFDWRAVATHLFHRRERAIIASAPEAQQARIFFQIWTLKEAYLKGIGSGSLDDMTSFFVPDAGGHVGDPQWKLESLAAPAGFTAALASSDPSTVVVDCSAELSEYFTPVD
jgi:4'-phosphopantetheinyl transferase